MSFFDGCNDVGDFDRIFFKEDPGMEKKKVWTRFLLMLGCCCCFFPSFRPLQFRQKDRRQRPRDVWSGAKKTPVTFGWEVFAS